MSRQSEISWEGNCPPSPFLLTFLLTSSSSLLICQLRRHPSSMAPRPRCIVPRHSLKSLTFSASSLLSLQTNPFLLSLSVEFQRGSGLGRHADLRLEISHPILYFISLTPATNPCPPYPSPSSPVIRPSFPPFLFIFTIFASYSRSLLFILPSLLTCFYVFFSVIICGIFI